MGKLTRSGRAPRQSRAAMASGATPANDNRRGAALAPPPSGVDFVDRAVAMAPVGQGLPPDLQAGIESLSGFSMDHVRVHRDSPQPARLQALAYAQGDDIHLAPGQEKHLPHEAWHIVQQAQGRVRPTRPALQALQAQGGASINSDPALECEADRMGAQALRAGQAPAAAPRPAAAAPMPVPAMAPVQRMTARVRREQQREPTAQEVDAARQSGMANSQRLAGHGRARHGKKVETPKGVRAQQARADREQAVEQAIQLQPAHTAQPAGDAVVQCWPPALDRLRARRGGFAPVPDPDEPLVSEAKLVGHRAQTTTATVEARRRDKVVEGLAQVGEEGLKLGLDVLGTGTIGVPLGTIGGAARSAQGLVSTGYDAHRQTGSASATGKAVGKAVLKEGVGEALGHIPVVGEFVGMVEGISTAAYAVVQSESSRVEDKQAAIDAAIQDRPVIDKARQRLAEGDLEPAARRRLEKAIARYDALIATGSAWQRGKAEKGRLPLLSAELDD